MKLILKRKYLLNDRTLGELFIDGKYFCKTLEDKITEKKEFGESCISEGKYPLIVNMSPRFKRELPRLENVPEFTGVLIHRGNTPKDTHGCILVGQSFSKTHDLVNSTPFETKLVEMLKANKEPHSIEILIDNNTKFVIRGE